MPWHPRGLHGRTPKHTWIGAVAIGSPAPIAPTPTSASNLVGGLGIFLRGGVASHTPTSWSAMARDTGIPGGEGPRLPKKEEEEVQMRRDRGGSELWDVEGTHSSLGKNPPTYRYQWHKNRHRAAEGE